MGAKETLAVLEHCPDLPPGDLRVLMAIANRVGPSGKAWPSKQTLADVCGTTQSGIKKSLRRLREAGYLLCEYSAGRSTAYEIALTCPPGCSGGTSHLPKKARRSEVEKSGEPATQTRKTYPQGGPARDRVPTGTGSPQGPGGGPHGPGGGSRTGPQTDKGTDNEQIFISPYVTKEADNARCYGGVRARSESVEAILAKALPSQRTPSRVEALNQISDDRLEELVRVAHGLDPGSITDLRAWMRRPSKSVVASDPLTSALESESQPT